MNFKGGAIGASSSGNVPEPKSDFEDRASADLGYTFALNAQQANALRAQDKIGSLGQAFQKAELAVLGRSITDSSDGTNSSSIKPSTNTLRQRRVGGGLAASGSRKKPVAASASISNNGSSSSSSTNNKRPTRTSTLLPQRPVSTRSQKRMSKQPFSNEKQHEERKPQPEDAVLICNVSRFLKEHLLKHGNKVAQMLFNGDDGKFDAVSGQTFLIQAVQTLIDPLPNLDDMTVRDVVTSHSNLDTLFRAQICFHTTRSVVPCGIKVLKQTTWPKDHFVTLEYPHWTFVEDPANEGCDSDSFNDQSKATEALCAISSTQLWNDVRCGFHGILSEWPCVHALKSWVRDCSHTLAWKVVVMERIETLAEMEYYLQVDRNEARRHVMDLQELFNDVNNMIQNAVAVGEGLNGDDNEQANEREEITDEKLENMMKYRQELKQELGDAIRILAVVQDEENDGDEAVSIEIAANRDIFASDANPQLNAEEFGLLQILIEEIFQRAVLWEKGSGEDDRTNKINQLYMLAEWKGEWKNQFGRMPPKQTGVSMSPLTLGHMDAEVAPADGWQSENDDNKIQEEGNVNIPSEDDEAIHSRDVSEDLRKDSRAWDESSDEEENTENWELISKSGRPIANPADKESIVETNADSVQENDKEKSNSENNSDKDSSGDESSIVAESSSDEEDGYDDDEETGFYDGDNSDSEAEASAISLANAQARVAEKTKGSQRPLQFPTAPGVRGRPAMQQSKQTTATRGVPPSALDQVRAPGGSRAPPKQLSTSPSVSVPVSALDQVRVAPVLDVAKNAEDAVEFVSTIDEFKPSIAVRALLSPPVNKQEEEEEEEGSGMNETRMLGGDYDGASTDAFRLTSTELSKLLAVIADDVDDRDRPRKAGE